MSDAKAAKKQDKKAIAAFKKAFKKQTGVADDSKEWSKNLAAFEAQTAELRKWTGVLAEAKPDDCLNEQDRLTFWSGKADVLRTAAVKDKTWAGQTAIQQLPLLLKQVESVRKRAKAVPRKLTAGGRDVSVFLTDIPGSADMAPADRKLALEAAAAKTARGEEIYERIAAGDGSVTGPTPPGDAEALMWALKSKAQQKLGAPYEKGAMTVPNGAKLRKYLDQCPEVYSRLSSHLREQQGRNIESGARVRSKEGQTPRGIDMYNPAGDDQPGSLPAGMNTMLYQQVVLPNGEVALYLKMETQGSFGHPGDNRKLDPTVPKDRAPHPNDGARARKHLKNLLIKDNNHDHDLAGLREQTPKPVVEAAKAIVEAVEGKKAKAALKGSYGTEPKWHIRKKAVPRISLFLKAVDNIQKHAGEDGWELGGTAEGLLDRFGDLIQDTFPDDLLESDRRMGGEVVLSDDDMAPGDHDADDEADADELDDGFDEDDAWDEDGALSLPELVTWCSEIAGAVTDDGLRDRLRTKVDGELVSTPVEQSVRSFLAMAETGSADELGPRAALLTGQLKRQLEAA